MAARVREFGVWCVLDVDAHGKALAVVVRHCQAKAINDTAKLMGRTWPGTKATRCGEQGWGGCARERRRGVRAPQFFPVGLCAITSRPDASLATSMPELLLGMAVRLAALHVTPPSTESAR